MPQLSPIPLVAPGSLGLNKENENSLLPPQWATVATNCVLDRNGRLAARKGWADQTTNNIAGDQPIDVLHEYIQQDGDTFIISTANNVIYKDIDDYTDPANDLTGAITPTADDWQFVNFNDEVIGIQSGEDIISWDGAAADFSVVTASSGTVPNGSCGLAAFGRLWIVTSDKQTIKYCALLDKADWGGSDAGQIDMDKVWTNGTDTVQAIAALGSSLIVFGMNHIIIWEDGTGSDIGIDPTQIQIVQTIEGTGCIARDSIQKIGEGDLLFLSRHGVQSLGQLLSVRDRPVSNLTKNYRTEMQSLIDVATLSAVRSLHSPEQGFYLLTFPASSRVVVLDTRRFFRDDEGDLVARITEWNFRTNPTSLLARENGDILLGFAGEVGKYTGNIDDASPYTMEFFSAWIDLGPNLETRLKILKEIAVLVSITAAAQVAFKWEFDFSGNARSRSVSYNTGTQAEYNVALYNVDKYSGGSLPVRKTINAAGEGQYIRVGMTASINNFDVALQLLQLYPKLGRLA